MSYADKSLAPGETIVYRARYHWIFYRVGLFILFLAFLLGAAALYASRKSPGEGVAGPVAWLALAFAILAGMILLARWFRAKQDEFVVTDRRVLRAVGVLSKSHEQAPIEKIQDITVSQSWIGRMLDYGDVELETASQREGMFVFPTIRNPEAFRTAIWGRPRAGAASADRPASPTATAAAAPVSASLTARLEELENLKRRGMVSETEYASKRQEILAHL